MNTTRKTVTMGLSVALIAGCLPEKRVIWSPDGKRAAVTTSGGLYFIDGSGKVLKPRLTGTEARCDWFSDSKRLAVVHSTKAQSWDEMAGLFNAEQSERIKVAAEALRKRVLAYEGDWDDFDVDPDERLSPGIETAVILYLRDRLRGGLPEKLGDLWEDIQKIQSEISVLQIFTLTDNELQPGKVLVRWPEEIRQPKVSPNDRNVAMLMVPINPINDAVISAALHVVSTDGGAVRVVAPCVALEYDWSPDGGSLAFIRSTAAQPDSNGYVQLGALTTIRVADTEGNLLETWTQENDRVGLLFNVACAVRWLSDGRLLFSSYEVTLPATTRDMPQRWTLFAIDPRMPASVIRVLGRDFNEPLIDDIALFEVSPDGKRLLLPGPKGRVTLYELATGKTTALVDMDDPGGDIRALPTWRSNTEVCHITPVVADDGSNYGKVVLWRDGEVRCISDSWSHEMKDGWLVK